jgi:hypothetical protein
LEKVLSIDLERDDLAEAGMGSAGEWDADEEGNIYLVCFKNNENFIYRFNPGGELLTSFGRRGQGPGELQWPFLGGVSGKNEISLVDYGHKFVVYDTEGRLLRESKLKRHTLHIDALSNGKLLTFGFRPELSSAGNYVDSLVLCDSNFEEITRPSIAMRTP